MSIQSNQHSRAVCQLTGKIFASKELALASETETAQRRCQLAGRKLSPAELINPPLFSPDDRSVAQKSAWRVAHPWLAIEATTRGLSPEEKLAEFDNPNYQATEQRRMTAAEYRAQTRAQFAAKISAKPVVDADREKCKAYAEKIYEQAAWGNAPVHVRDLVELLCTIARDGRLEDFQKYAGEYVATVEAIRADLEASLLLQRAQIDTTAAVEKFSLADPEQPAPEPVKSTGPEHFSRVAIEFERDPERRKHMEESTAAYWHYRATREDQRGRDYEPPKESEDGNE